MGKIRQLECEVVSHIVSTYGKQRADRRFRQTHIKTCPRRCISSHKTSIFKRSHHPLQRSHPWGLSIVEEISHPTHNNRISFSDSMNGITLCQNFNHSQVDWPCTTLLYLDGSTQTDPSKYFGCFWWDQIIIYQRLKSSEERIRECNQSCPNLPIQATITAPHSTPASPSSKLW